MKLKNFTKKKAAAFGLAFGVAAGAGGIAAAYFTSSGTGTGTASVGTPSGLKVTGGTVSNLLPAAPQTATFTVKNNNAYSVSFTGASVTVTQSNTACDITAGTLSQTGATLAASGTAGTSTTITVQLTMATNPTYAQTSCSASVALTA